MSRAKSLTLKGQVEQKVRELDLSDAVRFLGIRQDVPDLLQAMDVFVLPSYYEGLPVVGVEAQAAGLPCFFSDAITAETKITDLVSFINLSQTPANWAQKIVCCANDFPRTNMHQEIEKSGFDIQNAAKELEKLYIGM